MQQRSFPPYHPPAPSHHILAPGLLLLLLCHQLHQALPSLPFTLPLPPALSQASSTDPFFLRPSHTRFNHSLPKTVSTVDPLILVRVLNRFTSSWCQSFDSSPTLRKSLSISDRIHRGNISQGQATMPSGLYGSKEMGLSRNNKNIDDTPFDRHLVLALAARRSIDAKYAHPIP